MRAARAVLALALVAVSSADARASDPCQASPLVSTCVSSDTLWPHAGPQLFATVGGVETVAQGTFGFGLVADYISRPIVLTVPGAGGGTPEYAVDNQVNGTFLWAVGITRRLQLDVALPVTFGQDGSGAGPVTGSSTPLHTTAMRDLRFGLALQLVPRTGVDADRLFGLTARVDVSAPTGDRDQFAGEATAVFAPSLAADLQRGRWFAGLEVGARIRPATQLQAVQGDTVGSQATIALGVGYDLLRREKLLAVMAEARSLPTFATQSDLASTPGGTVETANGTVLAPSEWMLSVRSAPLATDDFSITVGGGGPIGSGQEAFTSPRFRFFLGVRYAPTGRPRHAAPGSPPALGLSAKTDRCKDDPDSADGFKDDDGCPDEDTDKDGIDDRYDRCPLVAEDFVGPSDGCPEASTPGPTPAPAPPPK